MSNLISLLDRPIAYQACFVRFGGVTGAVLLSACHWHNRMDGEWFYKTQSEIKAETGLSREEQETARRRLICRSHRGRASWSAGKTLFPR